MNTTVRKNLCADSLVSTLYQYFQTIPDLRKRQSKASKPFIGFFTIKTEKRPIKIYLDSTISITLLQILT